MSQPFNKSSNTIAKLLVCTIFVGPAGLAWALTSYNESSYNTEVGVEQQQPVPFSHKHHVSGLGLDCRYCHTTVETSSFAGMPPIKTCMTCHSQIWSGSPMLAPVRNSFATGVPLQWNRVYDLPDFAYFDHSIHVNKGVGCESCHGRVDQMPLMRKATPLTMKWCLECHRNPLPRLRPREAVFEMGYRSSGAPRETGVRLARLYKLNPERLTDCIVCHR